MPKSDWVSYDDEIYKKGAKDQASVHSHCSGAELGRYKPSAPL